MSGVIGARASAFGRDTEGLRALPPVVLAYPSGVWSRIRAAFGLAPSSGVVAIEGERVVLRELARARALPQEPQAGPKEISRCPHCDVPVRRVVFTTAGGGEQVAIWRAYPLAVDGWLCASCGWSAVPRFISPEESSEYGRRSAEHAANGELDDAEFWLRRIIASWPGYAAGYADMGQLSLARADAADTPEDKHHHRLAAESWFRRAAEVDSERRLPGLLIPFARVLALNGQEAEALAVLDSLVEHDSVPATLRADAADLAAGIRAGKALFSRAM